jgi:hypothetical protein
MHAGNYFWIIDGGLAGVPVIVANDVKTTGPSIALGAGWMGYIDSQSHAKVKAGTGDAWTQVGGNNITSLSLGGVGANKRIGVVEANVAKVREGSIGSTLTSVMSSPAASRISVNAGRIAVLTTAGEGYAKQGPFNASWWNQGSGYSDVKLN